MYWQIFMFEMRIVRVDFLSYQCLIIRKKNVCPLVLDMYQITHHNQKLSEGVKQPNAAE